MGVVKPEQGTDSEYSDVNSSPKDSEVNKCGYSSTEVGNIDNSDMGKGKLNVEGSAADGPGCLDELSRGLNNLRLAESDSERIRDNGREIREILHKLSTVKLEDSDGNNLSKPRKIPIEDEEDCEDEEEAEIPPTPHFNVVRTKETLDGEDVYLISKGPTGGIPVNYAPCPTTLDHEQMMRNLVDTVNPNRKYMRPNRPCEVPVFSTVSVSDSYNFAAVQGHRGHGNMGQGHGGPKNYANQIYGDLSRDQGHRNDSSGFSDIAANAKFSQSSDIISMRGLNGGSVQTHPMVSASVMTSRVSRLNNYGSECSQSSSSTNGSSDQGDSLNQFDSSDADFLMQSLSSPESAFSPMGSEYTAATSPASGSSVFGPHSPYDDDSQLYDQLSPDQRPSDEKGDDHLVDDLSEYDVSAIEAVLSPEGLKELLAGHEPMGGAFSNEIDQGSLEYPNEAISRLVKDTLSPTEEAIIFNMLNDGFGVDENSLDLTKWIIGQSDNGNASANGFPQSLGLSPTAPNVSNPHSHNPHNPQNVTGGNSKRKTPGGHPERQQIQSPPHSQQSTPLAQPSHLNPQNPHRQQKQLNSLSATDIPTSSLNPIIPVQDIPPQSQLPFVPNIIPNIQNDNNGLNLPISFPAQPPSQPMRQSPLHAGNQQTNHQMNQTNHQMNQSSVPNNLNQSNQPTSSVSPKFPQMSAPACSSYYGNCPIYHPPQYTAMARPTNPSQQPSAPIVMIVTTSPAGGSTASHPITITTIPTVTTQTMPIGTIIMPVMQPVVQATGGPRKILPKDPTRPMTIVRTLPPTELKPLDEDKMPNFDLDKRTMILALRWINGLKNDEEIYCPDEDGDTLLHNCAMKGEIYLALAVMKRVKKEKTKEEFLNYINKKNEKGQTALYQATVVNCPEIVSSLINEGADPNCPSQRSQPSGEVKYITALHVAAERGEAALPTLKCLLSSEALQKDASNSDGHTALYCAAKKHGKLNNNKEVINSTSTLQVLLRHGADIIKQDGKTGQTTLHAIVEARDVVLLRTILGMLPVAILKPALQQESYQGNTCLHIAAQLPSKSPEDQLIQRQILENLLDYGSDTSIRNVQQKTAKDLLRSHDFSDTKLLDRMKPSSKRR